MRTGACAAEGRLVMDALILRASCGLKRFVLARAMTAVGIAESETMTDNRIWISTSTKEITFSMLLIDLADRRRDGSCKGVAGEADESSDGDELHDE